MFMCVNHRPNDLLKIFFCGKMKEFFCSSLHSRTWLNWKNGAAPVPIANWVCFDLWSIQLCWNHHDSTACTLHHIVIGASVYIYTTSFDVTFHIQMQLPCAFVYHSSEWNGEKLANFHSSELYSSSISFFSFSTSANLILPIRTAFLASAFPSHSFSTIFKW